MSLQAAQSKLKTLYPVYKICSVKTSSNCYAICTLLNLKIYCLIYCRNDF